VDIPAAGAIVFDDADRLLLIRRLRPPGAGLWSVPGGKCLPHEASRDTCVRECLEETGLQVAVLRSAGSVYLPAPGGNRFAVEDFLCTIVGGTPQAGDDAGELRWATRAELARLPLVAGLLDTLTSWGLLPGGAS
jgi:8-oxo-dGTP diphosphatase